MKPGLRSSLAVTFALSLALPAVLGAQLEAPASTPEATRPLPVGAEIPNLTFEDQSGEPHALFDLIGEGPAILLFYRGGWCPYCNTQLGQLHGIEGELTKLGYRLFAISPDRSEKLAATGGQHQLAATLLSDSDIEAVLAFGLAFTVDDKTVSQYRSYNIDLEEASGHDHHVLPIPAVYLVDQSKHVRFAYHNPDYRVRLEAEELLAAARQHAAAADPHSSH